MVRHILQHHSLFPVIMQPEPAMHQRQALSPPVRAYLLGIALGMGIFLDFAMQSPGKILLALALATVPQVVLGRALNWRAADHYMHWADANYKLIFLPFKKRLRGERFEAGPETDYVRQFGGAYLYYLGNSFSVGFAVYSFALIILLAFPW